MLQSIFCVDGPMQVWPPFMGAGFVHVRVRFWPPFAHLEWHSDHADHADHPPFTGIKLFFSYFREGSFSHHLNRYFNFDTWLVIVSRIFFYYISWYLILSFIFIFVLFILIFQKTLTKLWISKWIYQMKMIWRI